MILYSNPAGAGSPDQGSAVMEVRNKILERVGEPGLVDDNQIRSFVRSANRKVWTKALLKNKDPWTTRSGVFTYDPAVGSFPLDTISTNLASLRYVEINRQGTWYPVFEGVGGDRWQREPGANLPIPPTVVPAEFYLEGSALFFSPNPSTGWQFRAAYVPTLADPADNEALLGGKFPQHHDLVATEAARLCFSRDERTATPWDREASDLLSDFLVALTNGQGNGGRRTRARSPYSP